jgi:hypothetical protein
MFVKESNLERKIWKAYVEDHLEQNYFKICVREEGERDHLLKHLLKWEQSWVYMSEWKLCTIKDYARSAWCAHCRTPWWENNKGVVGENFLLAENEGRRKTLHSHMCKVLKYQVGYIKINSSYISIFQSDRLHLRTFQWTLWHVSQSGRGRMPSLWW